MNKTMLLWVAVLAGCSLTPRYERPDVALPEAFSVETPGEPASLAWWTRFGSAELDALMDEALSANHDLAAAVERIEQARAGLRGARSALLPSAGASAGVSSSRRDGASSEDGEAAVSIAYEVDLFGANRAGIDAAEATLLAGRLDRDSVALVLQADLATAYFQALAFQDRLAIAHKNLEAARELLRLVQLRYDNGAATALALAQQKTTLLGIQAQIPALAQSRRETLHALAVLLGRVPQGFEIEAQSLAGLSLPAVDAGQPAALLERRPDVRRIEAQLIAADADIGAARAALFPGLDLSASAGVSGLISGGSSTVSSVAASLAQYLFDGGQRRAAVELSESSRRELAESYAQAVLTSLQEVEDALVAIDSNETRMGLLEAAAQQARESYRLAIVRYESGADDLLTLLDAQRSQLDAEDSLVQAQLARYAATTDLFRALGGEPLGADQSSESTAAMARRTALTVASE